MELSPADTARRPSGEKATSVTGSRAPSSRIRVQPAAATVSRSARLTRLPSPRSAARSASRSPPRDRAARRRSPAPRTPASARSGAGRRRRCRARSTRRARADAAEQQPLAPRRGPPAGVDVGDLVGRRALRVVVVVVEPALGGAQVAAAQQVARVAALEQPFRRALGQPRVRVEPVLVGLDRRDERGDAHRRSRPRRARGSSWAARARPGSGRRRRARAGRG